MKSKPKQLSNHSFQALGTHWEIVAKHSLGRELEKEIATHVEDFDKTYSRFRSDSLVHQISKRAGVYQFPQNADRLMSFYKELYDVTAGLMTPLIGDMLVRAGYDDRYSFNPQPQRDVPRWEDALEWDGSSLRVDRPLTLDFGAAGKGYLVDVIAGLLESSGIGDYVVDGSGDMRHSGDIENKVGLEHPNDTRQVIGTLDVKNKSLAASATNRRQWSDMHHIFDPHTKKPAEGVTATWVIADSVMVADGIATALFFVDPNRLQKFPFRYVRMHNDGSLDYSPELGGQLF